MTLLRRVVLTNAAVLAVATAVLALSPLTISERVAVNEVAVLAVYVVVISLANALLLRRALDPLDRLTQLARTADPLRPGTRVAVEGADPHVTELSQAMNDMLARLEDERRTSGRRALAAQEDERRRIARELHDEVGQSLTAVLLQLEAAGHRVPREVAVDLEETREAARRSLEDVRAIGRADDGALVTTPLKARFLLADDHVMVRHGLRLVLDMQPDREVVAEAGDGVEAVEMATAQPHLDFAVLDVSMPRMTGLQAVAVQGAARRRLGHARDEADRAGWREVIGALATP